MTEQLGLWYFYYSFIAMSNLFSEKFSQHLKLVLAKATKKAADSFNKQITEKELDSARAHIENKIIVPTTETAELTIKHILDSLLEESGSIAAEILKKSRIGAKDSKHASQIAKSSKLLNNNTSLSSSIQVNLEQDAVASLVKAVQISHQYRHYYIGTEHLLKSIILLNSGETNNWFRQNMIATKDLEKNIQVVLESTSKFPDLTAVFRPNSSTQQKTDTKNTALEYFGKDLTSTNIQKDIDPVIGRDLEIERLISILCRRYKNNPLLLGEAGVGKTAIVEGLAKRINTGEVPPILANKKIISLDLGAMVAGTIYRGEFEARLKQALEVSEKEKNIILFIDEMHTIIGAGSASGSLDAANMLKPALARGTISIIGATTIEEYKKNIQTDSALERRLQPIMVDEPTEEETKQVLSGIKENYEKFHNVIITQEAIDAAVQLSARFLPEKLQPDKSIDLIDEAAALVKVEKSNNSIWKQIRSVEQQISKILEKKQNAVAEENYSKAIILKQEEEGLQQSYKHLLEQTKTFDSSKITILKDHITRVVSSLTKIPLGELAQDEREKLSSLEYELKKKIIGQDKALSSIANLIRRSRTNVADPNRPIASFIFLGPSGVGKTETARELARTFFGDSKSLITVDMSEFSESYSVSKLVGAPAGYVGYRDSNNFTDKIRANPYSVVLLDEIEKAHSEIFNLFLQILELGQITDSTGRAINFRNTIIIMTSNIGLESFNQASRIGFDSFDNDAAYANIAQKEVIEQLKANFRAEFLNRIDNTIVFSPLSQTAYQEIVRQYLSDLNKRLEQESTIVEMSDKSQKHVVNSGYAPETGARSIRKFFQDNIESEIAKL
ncbi:MAG: ATP-dependent Clp protease ATP-binding subunit, partial [Patescibacteria group bacterium]|nr:ATP-dependent Clp protease ATP-binding subunit [Patescibacteria group bacterium]